MRWYFEKMNKKEMTDDFQELSVFFLYKKYSVRMRRSTYFSENGKKKLTRIQRLAEWQKK
jgi:hypothetical protein